MDLRQGQIDYLSRSPEEWSVTVVETGANTQTGGRLKQLANHLGDRFMVTYGDGVANVNIRELLRFHRSHGNLATVTAVRPSARFGALELDGDHVRSFSEKSQASAGWINGGYFVLERRVLDYIDGDDMAFERVPMERLAAEGQLRAFRHDGFWEPMDTQRDLDHLNELWSADVAPWKVWRD